MTVAVMPEIKTFPGKPATIVEILHHAMEKHNRKDAFNYKKGKEWVSLSYQDIASSARKIALGLNKLGVHHGDHVGILGESRVEWIAADLGTLASGAADVPLYATLTAKQCGYILKDSGARVMFIS